MIDYDQQPGEVLRERISSMGEALGREHYHLSCDLAQLTVRWKEFKTLYAESRDDVEILNRVAPGFFGDVQQIVWAQILLQISRLTDSASIGRNRNLTITRLPEQIQSADLKQKVAEKVEEAKQRTAFAREWRNKEIAHRDLSRAVDLKSNVLRVADRKSVEEALEAIGSVLNLIQSHFEKSQTSYGFSTVPLGGAGVLKRRLREYVKVREGS